MSLYILPAAPRTRTGYQPSSCTQVPRKHFDFKPEFNFWESEMHLFGCLFEILYNFSPLWHKCCCWQRMVFYIWKSSYDLSCSGAHLQEDTYKFTLPLYLCRWICSDCMFRWLEVSLPYNSSAILTTKDCLYLIQHVNTLISDFSQMAI